MKTLVKGCLAAVMVFGVMHAANADFAVGTEYFNNDNISFGVYLGLYIGNDKNTDVADNVLTEIENLSFYNIEIITEKLGSLSYTGDNEDGPMSLLTTIIDGEDEIIGGTWSSGDEAIDFYAVKAGNLKYDEEGNITQYGGYTVWYVGEAMSGAFTTAGLGDFGSFRELSHLSGYTSTASVPEPATLSLLGIGLLSMGAFRFRRKK